MESRYPPRPAPALERLVPVAAVFAVIATLLLVLGRW
jgi:hypothetical protein